MEARELEIEGRPLQYVYEHYGASSASGAVVCVHGITRNRHDFSFLASRLQSHRLDVYAPDLFGHGDSDHLDPQRTYEKEMFLDQLVDLIRNVPRQRIGLVGSSYGGLMGIRLASRADSPLSCLVLNDAGVGIRKEFYEETAKKIRMYPTFGSMRSVEGWVRIVMRESGELPEKRFEEIVRHSVRQTPSGDYVLAYDRELPRVWLGNHGREPEPWSMWENIRCPVLVVRGAHSDVLTPRVVAEMKARKPEMELLEIEGAGHFPHLMNASQTEHVEAWLAAHLQPDD